MTLLCYYDAITSLFCSVTSLNLLVHLIKSLVCQRILEYQISYNYKKDGGNDGGEPQDCVLNSWIIITNVSIVSIYRSADE